MVKAEAVLSSMSKSVVPLKTMPPARVEVPVTARVAMLAFPETVTLLRVEVPVTCRIVEVKS
ncbi:MAG: hypothetical protein UU17_C0041G0008 [Candidatus Nomurabacteria bacterium GW2011_GWA1_40_8]|nr:MAG: hypothetical protein UU17_C0041G0008 [Candidatus Nomurabacteria bacterium GW2011_GWA1_40_8]